MLPVKLTVIHVPRWLFMGYCRQASTTTKKEVLALLFLQTSATILSDIKPSKRVPATVILRAFFLEMF